MGGSLGAALDWLGTVGNVGVESCCCGCTQTMAEWWGSSCPHSTVPAEWLRPPLPSSCRCLCSLLRFPSGQAASSSPAPLPLRRYRPHPRSRQSLWWRAAPRCWAGSAGAGGAAAGCGWASATMRYPVLSSHSPCRKCGRVHYRHCYPLRHCHWGWPFYAVCWFKTQEKLESLGLELGSQCQLKTKALAWPVPPGVYPLQPAPQLSVKVADVAQHLLIAWARLTVAGQRRVVGHVASALLPHQGVLSLLGLRELSGNDHEAQVYHKERAHLVGDVENNVFSSAEQ